ncbi:MAG TPA: MopE-related protein [Pyrinomonadaceae bacterium]|jgi:hypothetical protein
MKAKYTSLLWLLLLVICISLFTPAFAQQSYPPSETIIYQDLDGNSHTLRAFGGRRIRYALPDSWIDGSAQSLSPTELITLIERTDLAYEKLMDVIGGEPRGDGLMIIAVVPLAGEGGVQGTALLGVKRLEITTSQLAATKAALAQGTLSETILHEIAHTFDLYRNYLSYYADSSHNWTEFWIAYSQYLLHLGDYSSAPELALKEKVYYFTNLWDKRASSASWSQCVRNGGGCESEGITANRASAGLLLRYARLHGMDAVKRAFEFFKSYKASHDPNEIFTLTPEQKNDLLVEALAYGANANISGELDAWYWPLSDSTREKLRQIYPSQNPTIIDADGDGWSPVRGDLDDHDPSVHPGAVEIVNGKDDDCNGFIDDVSRTASTTLFSPPARLTGHLLPGQTHSYRFTATGTLVIRLHQPSGNWSGFVSIKQEGTVTASFLFGLGATEPSLRTFTLTGTGSWQLDVNSVSGGEGDYDVVLSYPPAQGESSGDVFALPLRPPTSPSARTLSPGGLARATVTLPGVSAAEATAGPDAIGNWPTTLSGLEVLVAGQPSSMISVRHAGSSYTIDFVVSNSITAGASVAVLVRHLPTAAQWTKSGVGLRESAAALWAQAGEAQAPAPAVALESPTFLAFSETRRVPADGTTRVLVFASSLGNHGVETTRLIAELPDGRRFTLAVEYVGPTVNLPGLSQIIFKLDPAMKGSSRVLLSVEGGDGEQVTLPIQ